MKYIDSIARTTALRLQSALTGFDRRTLHTGNFGLSCTTGEPIFVIGAPRTGSTLVFQLILMALKLGYISNIMAVAPRYMIRIAEQTHGYMIPYRYDLSKSVYGYVPGFWGPNEAGQICRSWFQDSIDELHCSAVRRTINALANTFGAPLIIKNMFNSLRLLQVQTIFPGARFIWLRRDPRFTAQSILLVRKSMYGDFANWWSVKPPGYESVLNLDPFYQVMWQIMAIENHISKALKTRAVNTEVLDYVEVCRQPRTVMAGIGSRFNLELYSSDPFDKIQLEAHEVIKLNQDEWRRLETAYEMVKSDFGYEENHGET